tara:strand:- start:75 stop:356 length:282 start_codon:yes stop_codon:yes gene_type:complete
VTNNEWGRHLPVRGCGACYEGKVHHVGYPATKCNTCDGKGTTTRDRNKSTALITKQITKYGIDGNRGKHRELSELQDNSGTVRVTELAMAEED